MPRLLRTREVCTILALSRRSIYALVEAGRLPAIRLTPGGPLRFPENAVEKLTQPAKERKKVAGAAR
jgi:excisionase family DNA binding protein